MNEKIYFDNTAWNELTFRCPEPDRLAIIRALHSKREVLASPINCVEILNTGRVERRKALCATVIAVFHDILPDGLVLTRQMAHEQLSRKKEVDGDEAGRLRGFRSLLTHPASLTRAETAALHRYARDWNALVEGIRQLPDSPRDSSARLDKELVQSEAMVRNVSGLLRVSLGNARRLIHGLPICTAFACFVGAAAQLGLREKLSPRQPKGMDLFQLPYAAVVDTFVTEDRRFRQIVQQTTHVLADFGNTQPKVVTFGGLRKSLNC